jgi:hypothetical protein
MQSSGRSSIKLLWVDMDMSVLHFFKTLPRGDCIQWVVVVETVFNKEISKQSAASCINASTDKFA